MLVKKLPFASEWLFRFVSWYDDLFIWVFINYLYLGFKFKVYAPFGVDVDVNFLRFRVNSLNYFAKESKFGWDCLFELIVFRFRLGINSFMHFAWLMFKYWVWVRIFVPPF